MRHQITLVGGQLLPVFIGVKAFSPDKVHFIVSAESKIKIASLKSYLKGYSFFEYYCDAFDFYNVKSVCEKILSKLEPNDEVCFNLTGGTKIMVLAVQSLILEKNLNGFYINQDNTILELPSYIKRELNCVVNITEFLELSGHTIDSHKRLDSFSVEDFKVASNIFLFCISSYRYKAIVTHFSKLFKDVSMMPLSGTEKVGTNLSVFWNRDTVNIKDNGKEIFSAKSSIIKNLFFNSGWWELIVAKEVSSWSKAKELFVQCSLPFKGDGLNLKNEIDVLINIGHKLFFIECKSGKIKQDDINKMRIVKDTYGGIISKSVLVCLEMPPPNILEKCKDLNIEVFYLFLGKLQVNPLRKLTSVLDSLEKRTSI